MLMLLHTTYSLFHFLLTYTHTHTHTSTNNDVSMASLYAYESSLQVTINALLHEVASMYVSWQKAVAPVCMLQICVNDMCSQ